MNPKQLIQPVSLLCALLLGACLGEADPGAEPSTATAFVGRDSAGVKIVEYAANAWTESLMWSLDPEPVLAIGVVDGDPEHELASVSGAIRLDSGTIVVADAGAGEIRFFDAEGKHIRSVGRRGGGPGEYRHLSLIARHGADSLLIWDAALRRGSILGRDGTFGRTLAGPDLGGHFPDILGTFGDGSILGRSSAGVRPREERQGMVRFPATFFRFFPSGRVDTIGQFLNEEHYISGNSIFYHMPFARNAVAAAAGKYLHYGSSDTYEIRTYDVSGALARIVRSPRVSPVTREDINAASRTSSPHRRRIYAEMQWPETLPAYTAFKVDTDGNLWVGDYLRTGEKEQGWTIFGADGDLLGRLVTPPRFTVHEIGSDYVVGSAPDDLDVDRVLVYRLIRRSAPEPRM